MPTKKQDNDPQPFNTNEVEIVEQPTPEEILDFEERIKAWLNDFSYVAEIDLVNLITPLQEYKIKAPSWVWEQLYQLIKESKGVI